MRLIARCFVLYKVAPKPQTLQPNKGGLPGCVPTQLGTVQKTALTFLHHVLKRFLTEKRSQPQNQGFRQLSHVF
jgi:hypothetical protein